MPISPELLELGRSYSRAELAELFVIPNLKTSREGPFSPKPYNHVLFFVTLDKQAQQDKTKKYDDYFDDGVFHWDSPSNRRADHPSIIRIIDEESEPHLFVRRVEKIRGKTQKFIYAGRLESPVYDPATSEPVKFIFDTPDLEGDIPPALRPLIEWRPDDYRKTLPSESFSRQVVKKKRRASGRAQGLETDPKIRKAIEMHAMKRATQTYEENGYSVEDVSANKPFDLYCTKPGKKDRRVEVKGTRGAGETIIVTAGEVRAAKQEKVITDLFIVHDIVLASKNESGEPRMEGGVVRLVQKWMPEEEDLTPTEYRYNVPPRS
ncbi:DUF3427 domain-containing protein [Aliiruegeria sabulilitoris]|uniref:DUF3427 domain-containing protein n=1 Tax=Aliiruegeria sabulilitoris TaxID=1510458 RepID=UPI00082C57EC|nr:DUF3427 domain-containing protein [Aliiruegeria sabulilitoris]NDR58329.1 DUF3427 domain-containing protein [Pseudoruegeria sp. M32A2M]